MYPCYIFGLICIQKLLYIPLHMRIGCPVGIDQAPDYRPSTLVPTPPRDHISLLNPTKLPEDIPESVTDTKLTRHA
jgi:hypothetical protein